jgi:predicted amidohydrolase
MKDLTIAIYQMEILTGKKQQNLLKLKNAIAKENKPVDLWIVPELFTTGFNYSKFSELAEYRSESETIKQLEEISERYSTGIAGSILMKESKNNEKKGYLNIGFIIEPSKGLCYTYQKVNLWGAEKKHFIGGEKIPKPINFMNKANIGLLICYDMRFSEMYLQQVINGAEILITTAAWPSARVNHFNLLAKARALENTTYHVAVNRIGIEKVQKETTYPGSSRVINPLGKILNEAKRKDQIIKTKLKGKELRKVRRKIPVLKDRKKDLIKK